MSALLKLDTLKKYFPVGQSGLPWSRARKTHYLHAVDEVNLHIMPGECIGLVGESGCGKSTLVRLLTRLLDPSSGGIEFDGEALDKLPAADFARNAARAKLQMVFQDPTESLNPRYTAFDTIAESLRQLKGMRDRDAIRARVEEVAGQVGLPLELLSRFPHQLSGGQKARVGIARAISVHPKLLVLDEPTAALDVSVQAVILHLLADLREQLGMSYLFVSHDLNVVRLLCDRVLVMYLGKVVESGPVDEVFHHPLHPYTRALIAAIPGQTLHKAVRLEGEARSPIDPDPNICRFYGRCDRSGGRCNIEMPVLRAHLPELRPQQQVACHYPLEDS